MSNAKRAGDVLPRFDLACAYCGKCRELETGDRVPMDTCCYPQALSQLGWMADWLRQADNDPQEVSSIRQAANQIRRYLSQASSADIQTSLTLIAERAGARSDIYKRAAKVARSLGRRR